MKINNKKLLATLGSVVVLVSPLVVAVSCKGSETTVDKNSNYKPNSNVEKIISHDTFTKMENKAKDNMDKANKLNTPFMPEQNGISFSPLRISSINSKINGDLFEYSVESSFDMIQGNKTSKTVRKTNISINLMANNNEHEIIRIETLTIDGKNSSFNIEKNALNPKYKDGKEWKDITDRDSFDINGKTVKYNLTSENTKKLFVLFE